LEWFIGQVEAKFKVEATFNFTLGKPMYFSGIYIANKYPLSYTNINLSYFFREIGYNNNNKGLGDFFRCDKPYTFF
jgi:hypothetical protein